MNITQTEILSGKIVGSMVDYKPAFVEELCGKTIAAVGATTIEGQYGDEPCTVLFFTDQTYHAFVTHSE